MQKIMAVKGMNDILPATSYTWLWLEEKLRIWLRSYGYENIRTPIVEDTKLFTRAIGDGTDIVEKEMYSFKDSLNDDSLTLRPEGTAGTLRAALEHGLLYNNTQKLWYIGQMFRHERPQKGRYRQFHQLGVEALGLSGPDIDAELILMLDELWRILGINNLELQINCLGNKEERALHRAELIKYFLQHENELDEEAHSRLHKNPLRILDSKNHTMQELVTNAPKLVDFLTEESKQFYTNFKQQLNRLEIKFIENHRLVRGLDYYNLTVFEWVSTNLGAQGTIAAGGRYDPLIAELGGDDSYGIGFAIGIERLLLELEAVNALPGKDGIDIYIANNGENTSAMAFSIARTLRGYSYNVIQNMGNNSFKSQFKKANGLRAKFVIVIGEDELKKQEITIKSMQEEKQETIAVDKIVDYLMSHSWI